MRAAELTFAEAELDKAQRLVDQLRGGAMSLVCDVPSDLSQLTTANAAGRRILVPREAWPRLECLEHEGAGWEAKIVKVSMIKQKGSQPVACAKVSFLYARNAKGVPYRDEEISLEMLQPL